MIIDNTYFIDEIFIPHANPSVTDDVLSVDNDMVRFINKYSEECLIKCLGYGLYKLLKEELDISKPNGLKDSADKKWDDLLNGKEYTDNTGSLVVWKGIREGSSDSKNVSFIADYVYYFYEKSEDDSRVGIGNVKEKSSNAENVSKTPKVVRAWRSFVNKVQGESVFGEIRRNAIGARGVDYYGNNGGIKSMYSFIIDANSLDSDTYIGFNPTKFNNINTFGI